MTENLRPPEEASSDLEPFYSQKTLADIGYSRLNPTLWHAMTFGAWASLVLPRIYLVSWRRYPLLVIATILSIYHSVLAGATKIVFGRRIEAVAMPEDPVVIFGLARSGTSWLYNMLERDPQFVAPKASQVTAAQFHLLNTSLREKIVSFVSAKKRPMDNLKVTSDGAQEDDLATFLMGARHPYWTMAFPSQTVFRDSVLDHYQNDLENSYFRYWRRFIKSILLKSQDKTLLLKSPRHVNHIAELNQEFPKMRSIIIVRDPYRIYPSFYQLVENLQIWLSLEYPVIIRPRDLNETIKVSAERFLKDIDLLDPDRTVLIRYEDLRNDPVQTLLDAYTSLGLDFGPMEAELRKSLEETKDYKLNTYHLDAQTEDRIWTVFKDYATRFGYERRSSSSS